MRIAPHPGPITQNAAVLFPETRLGLTVIVSNIRPRALPQGAMAGILLFALALVGASVAARIKLGLGNFYVLKEIGLLTAGAALVARGLMRHHPFEVLGSANVATLARGSLIVLLAGLIGERPTPALILTATIVATAATLLDALDGWLARRTAMSSGFGARFDMETDAVLILVLSLLAWQFGKAGVWVLLSGLMRYLFVAAGCVWRALRQPPPPSFRRKTIAVVQMVGLLIVIAPFVPRALSAPVAAVALIALTASFLIDILWLLGPAPLSTPQKDI